MEKSENKEGEGFKEEENSFGEYVYNADGFI